MSTFHLIDLTEWINGGRTRCCGVLVADLPESDACGSTTALREPGQRPCPGKSPDHPPNDHPWGCGVTEHDLTCWPERLTKLTSPDEIPETVPLHRLTTLYQRHREAVLALVVAGDAAAGADLQDSCVARLVVTTVLAARAEDCRWPYAVDALRAGASRERVATALGVAPDEMDAGLRAWAGERRDTLGDGVVAEVLALTEPADQPGGGSGA